MIKDIMIVGSTTSLNTNDVSFYDVIINSLDDNFKYKAPQNIKFSYNFIVTRKLKIDRSKVLRVFNNIISNAVEAMEGEGEILFYCTKKKSQKVV